MSKKFVCLSIFFIALSLLSGEALAGSNLWTPQQTCTTASCGASIYRGTYTHDQMSNSEPMVLQIWTSGNECVRVAVTAQNTDLEATLTCPSGRTWQNDDASSVDFRPLIKAITPSPRGWCTLTISYWTGEGALGPSDFTVAYGRYLSSNPNCYGATTPSILSVDDASKSRDGATGNMPAGPSAP